ncbi:hypothetical protein TNCV_1624831 [Trichonephila clavipes]|nr:hypothetical protein TNCV_1624831 [Trichonephila clavipes]
MKSPPISKFGAGYLKYLNRAHDSQYYQKIPNPEFDLHPQVKTLPPPWFNDPNGFLRLSFRKFNIDSKLIEMAYNSVFLVPMGV